MNALENLHPKVQTFKCKFASAFILEADQNSAELLQLRLEKQVQQLIVCVYMTRLSATRSDTKSVLTFREYVQHRSLQLFGICKYLKGKKTPIYKARFMHQAPLTRIRH